MKQITLKNRVLYINQNENGSLSLYNEDGHIENNARAIIGSFGGVEKFLERCENINLSLEEFLNEKEKQLLLLSEAEKLGEKTFLGNITLLKYNDLFYKKNKYVWKSINEDKYLYLVERYKARLNEQVLRESRIIEEFNSLPQRKFTNAPRGFLEKYFKLR